MMSVNNDTEQPRSGRRSLPKAVRLFSCLCVLACAHRPHTVTSVGGEVVPASANHWTAAIVPLTSTTASISGRADIAAASNGQATVMLFLTGLEPGETYVWHIRRGSCAGDEPRGPASEYAPLSVNAAGRGTAAGTFPLTNVTAFHDYHIDVHPVGADPIACGAVRVDQ